MAASWARAPAPIRRRVSSTGYRPGGAGAPPGSLLSAGGCPALPAGQFPIPGLARLVAVLSTRAITSRSSGGGRVPTVFVLNGPNLNLLGVREPRYTASTPWPISKRAASRARPRSTCKSISASPTTKASSSTGSRRRAKAADGIVLNAGALTHTSVAILDALSASGLPVIEVHLSNIFRRERFRHHSYVSLAARGVICGLGAHGYVLALDAIARSDRGRTGRGRSVRFGGRGPPLSPDADLVRALAALLSETGLTRDRICGRRSPHPRRARPAAAVLSSGSIMAPGIAAPSEDASRLAGHRRCGDRADGRHRLSRAAARRAAICPARRNRCRGPAAADHRGDEGDERDSRAPGGAHRAKSSSPTARRSNMARC